MEAGMYLRKCIPVFQEKGYFLLPKIVLNYYRMTLQYSSDTIFSYNLFTNTYL